MPTLFEMCQYLEQRNYFIATLSIEAIMRYYNACQMAQFNAEN